MMLRLAIWWTSIIAVLRLVRLRMHIKFLQMSIRRIVWSLLMWNSANSLWYLGQNLVFVILSLCFSLNWLHNRTLIKCFHAFMLYLFINSLLMVPFNLLIMLLTILIRSISLRIFLINLSICSFQRVVILRHNMGDIRIRLIRQSSCSIRLHSLNLLGIIAGINCLMWQNMGLLARLVCLRFLISISWLNRWFVLNNIGFQRFAWHRWNYFISYRWRWRFTVVGVVGVTIGSLLLLNCLLIVADVLLMFV